MKQWNRKGNATTSSGRRAECHVEPPNGLTPLIQPLDALLWPLLIVCIVAMIVAPCNEVVVVKARCESFAFLHGSSAPADSAVAPRLPAVEAACCQVQSHPPLPPSHHLKPALIRSSSPAASPPGMLARSVSRLGLISTHLSSSSFPRTTTTLLSRSMSSSQPSGSSGNAPASSQSQSQSQKPLSKETPKFPRSDISKYNQPLGPGKFVNTAGCLIIGDEVLNGKTRDSNSNYLARWCFDLGIELKRIEVIADDEDEISEAVRRFAQNYDFVVTSGGIGPTPDDITYESQAKAFGAMPLEYHDETLKRMEAHQKTRSYSHEQTEEMLTARKRMALFPTDGEGCSVDVIFPCEELWVPVVRMKGRVHILPGV